eukprot:IDg22579t1
MFKTLKTLRPPRNWQSFFTYQHFLFIQLLERAILLKLCFERTANAEDARLQHGGVPLFGSQIWCPTFRTPFEWAMGILG